MIRFESDIKSIPHSSEKVYEVLANFDNFGSVLPGDKIKNWESFGDSCRFEVEGVGKVGLKIIDKKENDTVKYGADGTVPFNFYLWVQLKSVGEEQSKLKVTLDGDLNPMVKMMAEGPLKKFVNLLADGIANYSYSG